ncbi:MAG: hypothetical protein A2Y33_06680 [Spirochaetes bacterium GWF1_51_8]|nr:MAG: hypothetical protein A2Y33_06680 [Spirochaetes bacterium GWF1_51_8]
MREFSTLYEILGISPDAPADAVKTAFRKLAQVNHPDKAGNSPESAAKFIVIHHAYTVLADPGQRREYDSYLASSRAVRERPKYRTALPGSGSWESVLGDLNFVLWDIEDLIRDDESGIFDAAVMKILLFIEIWVLNPAGYPDYFYSARQMDAIAEPVFSGNKPNSYGPYVDIRSYFYSMRMRANKVLDKTTPSGMMAAIGKTGLRLIDGVIEAVNLARHYLSLLNNKYADRDGGVPGFVHSDPAFLKPPVLPKSAK